MKRLFFAVMLLVAFAFAAAALSVSKVGGIDYAEGGVSIERNGKSIAAPDIGEPIFSGDLIRTQGDGMLVIALDRITGLQGNVTVKAGSSVYIALDELRDEPRTRIQILTGAIGSKVSKLAGSPTVTVTTSSVVMTVRGTEYEVVVSINADDASPSAQQATLVACAESEVSVSDGQDEVEVPAGKALEKRPGERFRLIPVAVSSVESFGERWIADEISAFKADAPRAIADYANRYTELYARFAAAYEPFQKSPTPKKWADEDQAGTKIDSLDPEALREDKEIAGYLFNIKKVLFVFERVYYRVDEISDVIAGTEDEKAMVRPGQTAGDFLAKVKAERDSLAAKVARYRYIETLYRERNPGGDAFSSDDDFFGSSSGF